MERKIASNKCQRIKRSIEKSRIVENLEQAALGLPSTDPNTYILGGVPIYRTTPDERPQQARRKEAPLKQRRNNIIAFSFTHYRHSLE